MPRITARGYRTPELTGEGSDIPADMQRLAQDIDADVSAIVAQEDARQIVGRVNADGTVAGGSGFTVTRNSAGDYTINFTVPFAAAPAVSATPIDSGVTTYTWKLHTLAAGSARVKFAPTGGGALDVAFTFAAEKV